MLFGFIVVLIALVALLLIGVVLLQSGKGGGLAGIASGGTTQILGARQAPDVLEKTTWVLAGIFVALCLLTNFVIDTGDRAPVVQGSGAAAGPVPGGPAPSDPATPQIPSGAQTPAPAQPAPAQTAPAPTPAPAR